MRRVSQRWPLPIILATGAALGYGCGKEKDDPAPPATTYAVLAVENAQDASENAQTNLTVIEKCTANVDSGVFEAKFSSGANQPSLEVRIRDFSTGNHSYTCTKINESLKYKGCMVQIQTSTKGGTAFNTYTMQRESDNVQQFDYSGTCTMQVDYQPPRVTGTVTCTRLVQTYFESKLRNPISTSVTADVASTTNFFCDAR